MTPEERVTALIVRWNAKHAEADVMGDIAAAIRAAVLAEREACARLHDCIDPGCDCQPEGCGAMRAILQYRDAIRARGES